MKPKVKTKLEDSKLVAASVGFEEGDTCPDCGNGTMEIEVEGCMCPISMPPCSACTSAVPTCTSCGITEEEYEDKDRPELPLEVFNDKPVDPEKAWKELVRACKGNG